MSYKCPLAFSYRLSLYRQHSLLLKLRKTPVLQIITGISRRSRILSSFPKVDSSPQKCLTKSPAVLYDGKVALYTPLALWLSTGIRALDHALELLYHPLASEVPTKRLCLAAIQDLFTWLPDSKTKPEDAAIRQRLLLAAYSSLFPFLYTGGVGLSHSIGHSIGATYGVSLIFLILI